VTVTLEVTVTLLDINEVKDFVDEEDPKGLFLCTENGLCAI
jgi:hypothetical protein